MGDVKLLEELFDKKLLSVIKFFILNRGQQFYLQEIAKHTKVPLATVFRIVGKLKELKIIDEVRVKKFKLYRCADNDNVAFLEGFLKEGKRIIDNFAEIVGKYPAVEEVILHGKESEDKANVLIIGRGVEGHNIKQICAEFKEKYDFSINSLTLEREQYEQMSKMGLYSGRKRILFRKV